MEKAIVLNRIGGFKFNGGCKILGCNIFRHKDRFKLDQEYRKLEEKTLSEELSALKEEGFELQDEKIYTHNLYVDNLYEGEGLHGVYRYLKTGIRTDYKAYFGPMILLKPLKKKGCKKISCNTIGCRSKGGDIQYLNFKDNSINEEVVQKLNKRFGIRNKPYDKYQDDYLYYNIENLVLAEILNENYEALKNQFIQDVSELKASGYEYFKTISIPSYQNEYTNALLFSNTAKEEINFPNINDTLKHLTFLHKFDLWYFPRVRGIFRVVIDFILSLLNLKKEKVTIGTDIIEPQNLERLEQVYTADFNEQSNNNVEEKIGNIVGTIPVTIAREIPRTFWQKLWYIKTYEYFYFKLPGVAKS